MMRYAASVEIPVEVASLYAQNRESYMDDNKPVTMYHVAGRAGGKTTKLLRWVSQQENIGDIAVMCHSEHEKERLTHLWMEHYTGQPQPRFITPTEARNGSLAGRHTRLAIDNLDILLQQLYGYPVHYVSATGERIG